MKNRTQALVITPEELDQVKRPLPASWKKAAGLLSHKKGALKRHVENLRQEWD